MKIKEILLKAEKENIKINKGDWSGKLMIKYGKWAVLILLPYTLIVYGFHPKNPNSIGVYLISIGVICTYLFYVFLCLGDLYTLNKRIITKYPLFWFSVTGTAFGICIARKLFGRKKIEEKQSQSKTLDS